MFGKKKKKVLISQPTNFEHRVHTGYDKKEGRFIGLPPQWASVVSKNFYFIRLINKIQCMQQNMTSL